MIKICKICGREFEGRANRDYCSGQCRMEAKNRYMKQYRQENRDKIKKQQHDIYRQKCCKVATIAKSDNIALEFETEPKPKPIPRLKPKNYMPDKFKGSNWGRKYYKADRLDKIVMLSSALSKYEIEHLSYGKLSAMFESGRYFSLLNRVLTIKAEERSKHEAKP